MAEMEDSRGFEATTIGIYRTAAVVKGGRRFSFAAMVVTGDRKGTIGLGYGKGRGVPTAIEKAEKNARKNMHRYVLKEGTLPHPVIGKFGASTVKLMPASPGTGVIAGGTVRSVLEMVGVRDCLTKAYGSTNQKNLCRAAVNGLEQLRSREEIAQLRGVEIASSLVDEALAAGKRYEPQTSGSEARAKGPVNVVGKQKSSGRGGGRGRRGGRQEDVSSPAVAPTAAPAAESGGSGAGDTSTGQGA